MHLLYYPRILKCAERKLGLFCYIKRTNLTFFSKIDSILVYKLTSFMQKETTIIIQSEKLIQTFWHKFMK